MGGKTETGRLPATVGRDRPVSHKAGLPPAADRFPVGRRVGGVGASSEILHRQLHLSGQERSGEDPGLAC